MFYKTIILGLGILTLANCNAQKKNKNTSKTEASAVQNPEKLPMKEENIIYLNEGERMLFKEYEMNIGFKNISEDSRCPKGTTCVWEGVAIANVEIMGYSSRPMIVKLATTENAARNYHKSVDFNGGTISLVEVTPYPTAQNGSKSLAGKYRIGIKVSKTEEKNSTTR